MVFGSSKSGAPSPQEVAAAHSRERLLCVVAFVFVVIVAVICFFWRRDRRRRRSNVVLSASTTCPDQSCENEGSVGSVGEEGCRGPRGTRGHKGCDGQRGLKGCEGPQGVKGASGERGFRGFAGPRGVQGPEGLDGAHGLVGAQGIQGVQGFSGLVGAQGRRGFRGAQGFQAPTTFILPYSTPGLVALTPTQDLLFYYTLGHGDVALFRRGTTLQFTQGCYPDYSWTAPLACNLLALSVTIDGAVGTVSDSSLPTVPVFVGSLVFSVYIGLTNGGGPPNISLPFAQRLETIVEFPGNDLITTARTGTASFNILVPNQFQVALCLENTIPFVTNSNYSLDLNISASLLVQAPGVEPG